MEKEPRRVDVADLADDAMDELGGEEIRKVLGGVRAAGDGFAIGASSPLQVNVRGWDPKAKKAFVGKADD